MDEDQELIRWINPLRTGIEACRVLGRLSGFSLVLFLFESIGQFDGGEEANFVEMMTDRLWAYGGGQMGLAGTAAADISTTFCAQTMIEPSVASVRAQWLRSWLCSETARTRNARL
jgi:hypothetical protein